MKKDRIGELDEIREKMQELLDKKDRQEKEDKDNLSNNFFADMITEKKQERLEDVKTEEEIR